jgi:flagellar motor switch protein FliM
VSAALATRPVAAFRFGTAPAVRPDLPGLARIAAKVSRALQAAIATSGGSAQVGSGDVRTLTFADWQRGLDPIVAVARLRDRSIKGGLLLSVPPPLVATLVDLFYGGTGEATARLSFGSTEHRLFERLAARVGDGLVAAWRDLAPLAPAVAGSVFTSEDVALCAGDDLIAVQSFAVEDRHAGRGIIEIVYPLAAIRGFAGVRGNDRTEIAEIDPVWRSRLSDAVLQSRLPVRTVIARPTLGLAQLMALAPGDLIPVTLPARVPVTVAGRLLAHGTIGEANGRAAIKIDKLEHGALYDD